MTDETEDETEWICCFCQREIAEDEDPDTIIIFINPNGTRQPMHLRCRDGYGPRPLRRDRASDM